MATPQETRSNRSLLEQLPEIVRAGKRQAERILEGLESRTRIGLQTRELVTPAKDTIEQNLALRPAEKTKATLAENLSLINETGGQTELTAGASRQWFNRLIYGDNLLTMAALLAGDDATPSLRGKIDLIYIDPPFDSKADYRTKITLPGGDVEQKPTVMEQFAYSDTWADGTASYLAMIVPRLCLMREMLSDYGTIYVHLDSHVCHYVKLILDAIFSPVMFRSEIVWRRSNSHNKTTDQFGPIHDVIFFYSKTENFIFHPGKRPFSKGYIETRFKYHDKRGIYQPNYLTGPGTRRGDSGKPWRGFDPTKAGRHWAIPSKTIEFLGKDMSGKTTQEVLDACLEADLLVIPKKEGGQPMYRQYIREVGMIEPLVVHRQKDKSGTFLLLDGHLRLFALKQLGETVAECIISNDDECFTYNARINRLPPIQCHKMIVKAIRNGVNPERIASALDMPLNVVRGLIELLDGIAEAAANLLKDKNISEKAIRLLKKVKPLRQIEIAEVMVSANNYSVGYVESLILMTPSDQRVNPAEPKKKTGLSAEELANMEREMEALEKDFKGVKASFTENMMCLTCARGYIKKLLNNAKVVRFLNTKFSDIISGFENIAATEVV